MASGKQMKLKNTSWLEPTLNTNFETQLLSLSSWSEQYGQLYAPKRQQVLAASWAVGRQSAWQPLINVPARQVWLLIDGWWSDRRFVSMIDSQSSVTRECWLSKISRNGFVGADISRIVSITEVCRASRT